MNISDRCGWILAFVITLGTCGPARAGFTIFDLGIAVPGSTTMATAISNSGAIAGQISRPDGTYALAAPSGGGLRYVDVSTLPGIAPIGPGLPYSITSGVNSGGNVVGTYNNYLDNQNHAFATAGGKAVDYGSLAGTSLAGASTVGVAINSSGMVLGTAYQFGSSMAFRSTGPGAIAPVALPTGGSDGVAAGLNDSGTAVVNYINAQGASRICVAGANGVTTDPLAGSSVRGFGLNSYATGIANNGDIAGYGDFNGRSHAYLITTTSAGVPGQFIDIGTTGGFNSSKSLGLNSFGQVVGEMDASGYNSHAFLFDRTVGLFDLNSSLSTADARNWILTAATGINDRGQIVGQGLVNGQLHGFLLTPTVTAVILGSSSVPTPPSAVLAVAGLLLLGGWSRLRRGRTVGRGTV